MAEEQKVKKASQNKSFWKANRVAKRKSHYAAQFGLTDRNKKRKLRRHLRDFPNDVQAVKKWEQAWGPAKDLGVTGRGRMRAAIAENRRRLKLSLPKLVKASEGPQPQG